jgi:hypothetical protein
MRKTQLVVICTVVASLLLLTGMGLAEEGKKPQPPADTLKVDYFANANTSGAPDGTVRIVNPGTTFATVCADIYVFDTTQEMSECCQCTLSPDSIRTLSVDTDLTSNPLTGHVLNAGAIKVVSSVCGDASKLNPEPAVRAWATHIQNTKSAFVITEGESQDATLSSGEVSSLDSECNAIEIDGSGAGICTCGTGD